ncbi:trypsin [Bacteroidia bacterium]|nr:trypsin [Bacteroidia bacterium]
MYDDKNTYGPYFSREQQGWEQPAPQQSPAVPMAQDWPQGTHGADRRGRRSIGLLTCALCLGCALLGGVAGGAIVFSAGGQNASSANIAGASTPGNVQNNTVAEPASNEGKQALTIAQISEKAGPSAVSIHTTIKTQGNGWGGGLSRGGVQQAEASGSGFIIREDGYILTNNHVVSGATSITVRMHDGKEYPAQLVGSDSQTDVAVLKIDAGGLTAATIGNSKTVQVGDSVVAIGDPLGELSGTVTSGIISALDRSITIDDIAMTLMQTDAAINSGNSGGPLINAYGEVIGINTAKTTAVGVEGLGFAIPINKAMEVANQLIEKGYVEGQVVLGITPRTVTGSVAGSNGMEPGVYVLKVNTGYPAAEAGIQPGDRIVRADGREISSLDALNEAKEGKKVGDTMVLTIERNGRQMDVTLQLTQTGSPAQ